MGPVSDLQGRGAQGHTEEEIRVLSNLASEQGRSPCVALVSKSYFGNFDSNIRFTHSWNLLWSFCMNGGSRGPRR